MEENKSLNIQEVLNMVKQYVDDYLSQINREEVVLESDKAEVIRLSSTQRTQTELQGDALKLLNEMKAPKKESKERPNYYD